MPSQYNIHGVLNSSSVLSKPNGNVFVDDYEKIVEQNKAERTKDLVETKKKEELMQRATVGVKCAAEDSIQSKESTVPPESKFSFNLTD